MFSGLSLSQFRDRFRSEEDCLKYLIELKWGNGYECPKCGCNSHYKGREWHYKRCKQCCYNESATAGTMFHKCKLGLIKAFEIAFRLSLRKKGMSSCELAKEYACNQKSAWLLKAKYQRAMKSSEKHPLEGSVEVDEFMVGGFEPGSPGRSHGKKRLVVISIEKVVNKKNKETIGRAYAQVIEAASAKEFKSFFRRHIDPNAEVTTDGWNGYKPLKGDWDIEQKASNKGKNFPLLHNHIMNIKAWLRGIHHKCSAHYLQQYLDEYHFRFNRRGFSDSVFDKLIQRAVVMDPIPYKNWKIEN